MTKPKALVVEDTPEFVLFARKLLEREGFSVVVAEEGERGVALAQAENPELVLLDITLPGIDGFEVCRRIRAFSDAYIIMVSARVEEIDKVVGLTMGADDYVTKPFSPRTLMARIHTLLRRPRTGGGAAAGAADEDRRVFGDLVIDVPAHEVRIGPSLVQLTPLEYDLLQTLSSRPRLVFTRQQLLDAVWADAAVVSSDEHLVDIHIGHLRRKLGDDPRAARYVRTVRGVGYRMGPG